MGYWVAVAKRAAKEAAKDLKLDTVGTAIISMVSQGAVAISIYLATGGLNDNAKWARVGAIAAPFFTYPAAFLVRMLTVPPALHRELQSLTVVKKKVTPAYALAIDLQIEPEMDGGNKLWFRANMKNTSNVAIEVKSVVADVVCLDEPFHDHKSSVLPLRPSETKAYRYYIVFPSSTSEGEFKVKLIIDYGLPGLKADRCAMRELRCQFDVQDGIAGGTTYVELDADDDL